MTLKQKTRRAARNAIFGGILVGLLAMASFAWACTPAAQIESSLRIGRPGEQVAVTGTNFNAGAPVEIRWNSQTGALLATAKGPNFSVPVTVPAEAKSDVFFIVALQRELNADQKGMNFSGKAQSTFQVIGRSGNSASDSRSTTASDLWNGFVSRSNNSSSAPDAFLEQSRRQSPAIGLGVTLLMIGSAAMFSCVAALTLRRRTNATRGKNQQ